MRAQGQPALRPFPPRPASAHVIGSGAYGSLRIRPGMRFDVIDSGPAEAPAVVLLQDFLSNPQASKRSRAGECGGPADVDSDTTWLHRCCSTDSAAGLSDRCHGADVIALLDTAGLAKAHIVGHDWGGNQAWAVAGWYPDRAASLTTISTPHPPQFLKALRTSEQGLRSWYMAFFQLPWLPEWDRSTYGPKVLLDSGLPANSPTIMQRRWPSLVHSPEPELVSRIPFSTRPRSDGSACRPPTSGEDMTRAWPSAFELTADYVVGPVRRCRS
jgi:pimeloyl-ACP methyl ester carboxylesterase